MFNPLDTFRTYTIPIVMVASFAGGLYISHVWHSYQEVKDLQKVQEDFLKQDSLNRSVIEKLQSSLSTTNNAYEVLKGQLNEIPLTNTPCTVTPDAIRVWNHTTKVPDLPKDTTRTPETSSTTNTPIDGVEIKLLFENKLDNDKVCDEMRDQINSIIEWDKDTYGK